MRTFPGFLAVLGAMLCAGCATQVFDDQQLASATAASQVAMDACLAKDRAGELPTMTLTMGCYTANKRQYFMTIKLTKMDLVDAYETRTLALAGRFDRHEITLEQFKADWVRIDNELTENVLFAYRAQANQNARVAAALQGLGAGLQAASQSMRSQNGIDCTSIRTENITNTNCR